MVIQGPFKKSYNGKVIRSYSNLLCMLTINKMYLTIIVRSGSDFRCPLGVY